MKVGVIGLDNLVTVTSVGGEDTANHGDRRLENQKGGVRGVSSRLRPLEGHSSLVGLGLGRF